jgi:hypothetical protein
MTTDPPPTRDSPFGRPGHDGRVKRSP